jgi:hypothetical protein
MAINLTGGLPPEILGQQQQLNRQQQMAQMLMQQGQQMPQGQMISGRYVKPSIFASLAPLAQMYAGQRLAERGDKQALDLAKQLRQTYGDELKEFRNLMQGREELAPEQAGPTQTGQAIPQEMVRGAPNVQGAYDFASRAYNPALQQLGLKKLTEGPESFTLAEGAKRYMTMPDGTVKEVAAGGQKPRTPLQIDTGTAIELRDPTDPTIVLSRIPKSQMPAAGQVVEREDGTYLIDTRSGQARPILGPNNQPLIGGGGKPLTESQGKASAFQSQMVSANNVINKLESQGFDPTSLKSQTAVKLAGGAANPVVPVTAQQYKQAQNQWSEAFLRFKTGAAATEPEVVLNNRTFFPVFGDKPDQIAQKADMREQAERDIGIAAGRGSNLGAKPIGQQPKQQPAGKNVPVPAGVDPKVWNVMTPQEKALFQ